MIYYEIPQNTNKHVGSGDVIGYLATFMKNSEGRMDELIHNIQFVFSQLKRNRNKNHLNHSVSFERLTVSHNDSLQQPPLLERLKHYLMFA